MGYSSNGPRGVRWLAMCLFLLRAADANFSFGGDHKAATPADGILSSKQAPNPFDQRMPTRRTEPDQKDSVMGSGSETPPVREVQVLCDQKTFFALSHFPDRAVRAPRQSFLPDSLNVVPQRCQHGRSLQREVFVELDFHRICGAGGTGKSSSADAAANAIAA